MVYSSASILDLNAAISVLLRDRSELFDGFDGRRSGSDGGSGEVGRGGGLSLVMLDQLQPKDRYQTLFRTKERWWYIPRVAVLEVRFGS